jgi:hypothetical protein
MGHSLIGSLCLLLGLQAAEPPLVGQPLTGWYGAVSRPGDEVTLELDLQPSETVVGEPVTLSLRVLGVAQPRAVTRPDLRKLPEYAARFQIDNADTEYAPEHCTFRYTLRPMVAGSAELPEVEFYYYRPGAKYYRADCTTPTLTVRPRRALPVPVEPPVPLVAADFLFQLPEDDPAEVPALPLWLFAVPPVVALAWYVGWRWRYPDGERLARLRRSRAARLALARIEQADSAATLHAALTQYLHERFGLPEPARTSGELLAAWDSRFAPCPALAECLRALDRARYSAEGERVGVDGAEVARVIAALEARAWA